MTQSAADRKVGVIGLGATGLGIAKTLRGHDYAVYAYDTHPGTTTDFAKEGGVTCATPAEVAADVDAVISMVVNTTQTKAVLFGGAGAAGAMRRGSTFVMCSTMDPNWSIALEARLAQQGILYVSGPISGGATKAASGQVTMMTSAMSKAYTIAGDVLDAVAGKVYRLGDEAGTGNKVKIINQLLVGIHIATTAEAMALGLREGVTADALYEVITHNADNSWVFENRIAHVLTGGYMSLSAVDVFVKDLELVLDTARAGKFPLPLTATAHQMFIQTSTASYAREDDSVVIRILPGATLSEGQPR